MCPAVSPAVVPAIASTNASTGAYALIHACLYRLLPKGIVRDHLRQGGERLRLHAFILACIRLLI